MRVKPKLTPTAPVASQALQPLQFRHTGAIVNLSEQMIQKQFV